jgi:hypothetical protein
MRLPLVALALVISMTAPALAQQEWIDYSNQGDFFAVNLPGQPKIKDITWEGEYVVNYPGRVYTADAGASKYSVTVVDYTQALQKHQANVATCKNYGGDGDQCQERASTDLRSAILFATWGVIQKTPAAKLTHLVYTQADRVEGIDIHLTQPDASRTFASVFMHENRLYVFEGTVPKGEPQPLIFQQSVRFLDKDGKSIRYESPYTNGFPAPKRAR